MRALTLLTALLAICCAEEPPCPAGSSPVRVTDPEGEELRFEVCAQQAVTAEERRRGLIGAPPLDADEGLLIRFPVEGEVCIENGGLGYDLDVIWADASDAVVAVERIEDDGAPAVCHDPAQRVLEVPAGVAEVVRSGDRLVW